MQTSRADAAVRERLEAGLNGLGLRVDADQRERLLIFIALLARWNRAYNLTAVRDPLEMVARHLLDSLAVDPFLGGSPVLDVGTGPGLPGIPLALLHPERRFCMLDSNGKKVRFVRQATLELGLANAEAVQARMESYRPEEKFATIVSRAVTGLAGIWQATSPILRRPGRLLIMKGRYPGDELAGAAALEPMVHRLAVPFLDGERHLIEIRCD
jgi:16S rRNA (guanine527-N7)-methyltransferase